MSVTKPNILLVSPESDNEALWVTGTEGPEIRNNIAPLALATIAGLTPSDYHVDIWDELVHGRIDDSTEFRRTYDLVGVTGFKAHLPRCRELASIFRRRSIPVALGGPGVSATPNEYRKDFDILFIGEAERTWPRFLREWSRGEHAHEYRQIEKLDLADSPLPRWDSIGSDLRRYAFGSVQTTRGCPFDCEFCDVIYLYGRRSRHKPIKNVLQEVQQLERLGISHIFFCDDEFIGNPRYAKELLPALIELNDSFSRPLTFSTQLTMNLSKDEELLELMADANFDLVFIGIETPNKESLKETSKWQNVRKDLVGDVHKILSYGIGIRAGAIVGFDHDDETIFDLQHDFIRDAFLPSVAINMLKAPWGTRLWSRLRQEGRVVAIPPEVRARLGHPRSYTTILPKRMTRVELMRGYRRLLERISTWESFTARVLGFLSSIRRPPRALERLAPERVEASSLASSLAVDADGRRAIQRILDHAAEHTPYMLGRVRALIGQHAKYRQSVVKLLPQLDRQIELEGSGQLRFEVDTSPIVIGDGFRAAYRSVFPKIHRRVFSNLRDKDRTPQAVVEVFVDFLVRWGRTVTTLEPQHLQHLEEVCDRTCAAFNGQPPEQFVPSSETDVVVPNVTRLRLADDVLKTVEQILLSVGVAPRARAAAIPAASPSTKEIGG